MREIERVKSDQESEQKSLISLLQRQNVSLETKCEKLQVHLKNVEGKTRELVSTIDSKNKALAEKDEQRVKLEQDFLVRVFNSNMLSQIKLEDSKAKVNALAQEKEHLRHKVIRLNLNAKGEGANTLENMVKRITRETSKLASEFDSITYQYDTVSAKNSKNERRVADQAKLIAFLEKEIKKRNSEYTSMTKTFEEFLAGRSRNSQRERSKRLHKIHKDIRSAKDKSGAEDNEVPGFILDNKSVLKAVIPARGVWDSVTITLHVRNTKYRPRPPTGRMRVEARLSAPETRKARPRPNWPEDTRTSTQTLLTLAFQIPQEIQNTVYCLFHRGLPLRTKRWCGCQWSDGRLATCQQLSCGIYRPRANLIVSRPNRLGCMRNWAP